MQFLSGSSRFLPSKRVSALIVVVVALIVSTVIFRSDASQGPAEHVARLVREPEVLNEHDTDGDGVKDWEEELWGLSTVSTDTDGDGVGDAQEVEEKQAMLQEQRHTFLFEASLAGSSSGAEDLSETEKISRGILEQIVAFQSAGISIDGGTTNDIASVLGSVIKNPPAPVIAVRAEDIVTVPETSASLVAYANALGIILGGKATSETNEMLALAKFGETGDTAALDALADVLVTYDHIIADLRATTVPEPLRDKHAELINNFSKTKGSIALLAELGEDPIKGIQGLQTYAGYSQSVAVTFGAIRSYLRSRITLRADAPGYIIIETTTP